jgi:hypothetical protein
MIVTWVQPEYLSTHRTPAYSSIHLSISTQLNFERVFTHLIFTVFISTAAIVPVSVAGACALGACASRFGNVLH